MKINPFIVLAAIALVVIGLINYAAIRRNQQADTSQKIQKNTGTTSNSPKKMENNDSGGRAKPRSLKVDTPGNLQTVRSGRAGHPVSIPQPICYLV